MSPERYWPEKGSCSCLCLLTMIKRIYFVSSFFDFPFFTYYSSLFPSYSSRDVESSLGNAGFKDKSRKMKGNRPLPSKWALAFASANRADRLLRETVTICKGLLTGVFVTLLKAVVRHCFLAWQTFPPADGIRSSFLPDMWQNHTEDACSQPKLSWFWSVCTTACFSYTLKMVIQASVSYKIIQEKKPIKDSCSEKFELFVLKEKPWAAITFIFSLLWCLPSGFLEK